MTDIWQCSIDLLTFLDFVPSWGNNAPSGQKWEWQQKLTEAHCGKNHTAPFLGEEQQTEQLITAVRISFFLFFLLHQIGLKSFKILCSCQDLILKQKINAIKSIKFLQTKASVSADSVYMMYISSVRYIGIRGVVQKKKSPFNGLPKYIFFASFRSFVWFL